MDYVERQEERIRDLDHLILRWSSGDLAISGEDGDETAHYLDGLRRIRADIAGHLEKWRAGQP